MESSWLAMAKRLQALAATGQSFTRCQYDLERYQEIESIALRMLAELGSVPLEHIQDLFSDGEPGYVTPKVEVRGAVIREGKILLVQEKEDGHWAMPGGYADVGISAAGNVEKEVMEEAGLLVKAKRLYALRHKAKGNYPPDSRDFYKLHFLCECVDPLAVPQTGTETVNVAFFSPDALPPLSLGKNLPEDIHAALEFANNGHSIPWFD